VVSVGLTVSDPVADVEPNVPGVMAMVAAPVVFQLNVLLEPDSILAGLTVNEVIFGLSTVTVSLAVTEPAEFVAVKV
jgi:hypothetical protein